MRIVGALVAGLVAITPAAAGDYHPSWQGLYFGAHGGYSWGHWDGNLTYTDPGFIDPMTTIFANPRQELSADGWNGGGQIGFNVQAGRTIWGLEADATWSDASDGGTYLNDGTTYGFKDMTWSIDNELEAFGTIRARVGFLAHPGLLVYATGGGAWGRVSSTQEVAYPALADPVAARGKASETHWGWTVGGGAEWRISNNWSLKSEYLYVDLGSGDYKFSGSNYLTDPPGPHTTDSFPADLSFSTVRIGLNYRLGGDNYDGPLK